MKIKQTKLKQSDFHFTLHVFLVFLKDFLHQTYMAFIIREDFFY